MPSGVLGANPPMAPSGVSKKTVHSLCCGHVTLDDCLGDARPLGVKTGDDRVQPGISALLVGVIVEMLQVAEPVAAGDSQRVQVVLLMETAVDLVAIADPEDGKLICGRLGEEIREVFEVAELGEPVGDQHGGVGRDAKVCGRPVEAEVDREK